MHVAEIMEVDVRCQRTKVGKVFLLLNVIAINAIIVFSKLENGAFFLCVSSTSDVK